MFSNTFAGIAPTSAPSFVGAQIVGGVLAFVVIKALYPGVTPAEASDIIFPHHLESAVEPAVVNAVPGACLESASTDGASSHLLHQDQSSPPVA